MIRHALVAAVLVLLAVPASASADQDDIHLAFTPEVHDLPAAGRALSTRAPAGLSLCPELGDGSTGELRFGHLPHREAGEPLSSSRHFIPFAVVYEPPADPLVLFDFDRDGSLGCTERLPLLYHPTEPGTVFRTLTVRWTGDGGPDRQQRYRLSLPLRLPEGERAPYRIELVDVPAARHHQDGKETRFFLYDGNHDGLFDGRPGDALLIADAEAKSVSLDPAGSQLASLHLPVELPWGVYEVDRLDPAGPSLLLRRSGAAAARTDPGEIPAPVECPGLGAPAVTVGGAGDQLQLVYFWLSGCGTCAGEIERAADDRLQCQHDLAGQHDRVD